MKFPQILMVVTLSVLSLISCTNMPNTSAVENKDKGHLFIIGGGTRSQGLIDEMVKVADLDPEDYIVILPMANAHPLKSSEDIKGQIQQSCSNKIRILNFDSTSIHNQAWIDSLSEARLIYMVGGLQLDFMKVVLNTPIYTAIHQAFDQGSTIAGTSAGAAVMSKVMITGKGVNSQKYQKFRKVEYDHVATDTGLGLLPSHTIIDQHFIVRSRYNRLISVLAAYPEFLCVGINESTAIVCDGDSGRVVGERQVVLLSNLEGLSAAEEDKLISFDDLHFSLLKAGDTFELR